MIYACLAVTWSHTFRYNYSYIFGQEINTPMVNSKFLHLKYLSITIGGYGYDFLSLVSFFDSSPSLETFILNVSHCLSHNDIVIY